METQETLNNMQELEKLDQRREKRAGRAPVLPERRYEERQDSSSASGLKAEENMVHVRPEENKKRSHKRIKKERHNYFQKSTK